VTALGIVLVDCVNYTSAALDADRQTVHKWLLIPVFLLENATTMAFRLEMS